MEWKKVVHDIALAMKCLPSEFPDDNDHIIRKAQELQKGSIQWISVEDKLPENGQEIVGFAYCHEHEPGAHGVWDEVWDKDEPIGAMTHWMPLPSPPNESEKAKGYQP